LFGADTASSRAGVGGTTTCPGQENTHSPSHNHQEERVRTTQGQVTSLAAIISPEVFEALLVVVGYHRDSEQADYLDQDEAERGGHVFTSLVTLRDWLVRIDPRKQAQRAHELRA
jgi:hypothetical protein